MIFSFNGRRLVTSLILVITTIILFILLIVNLDCIIFTEATVNTSTSASTSSLATTATHPHPYPTSANQPAPPPPPLGELANHPNTNNSSQAQLVVNITNTGTSFEADHHQVGSQQQPSPDKSLVSVVLAKIKSSTEAPTTVTGGGGSGDLANSTATTTTIDPLLATTSTSTLTANNNIVGDPSDYKENKINQESPNMSSNNSSNNNNSSSSTNSTATATSGEPVKQDDLCSSMPTPDRNNSTSLANNETAKYFDIDYASRTFLDSMEDKNAISLHHYLNGFKELMKFFHSLGTIFLFVTSDLETKIGLLEGYRNTEKGGCNPAYLTIQSAIEYETKENLLRDTKRQSGARTVLRLHRALEFLSSLMLNLSRLSDADETAPSAREAYSNTLAKHHPWTIRTIASFAMRTLPHKKQLVESVLGKENAGNETLVNEKMLQLANVTENLFKVVDKYYEENDIKDLP